MPFSSGINRVFLVGNIMTNPTWEIVEGIRLLYFELLTNETIKSAESFEHSERHTVMLTAKTLKNNLQPQKGDFVYIQGSIRTRKIFENGIKLYKCEIMTHAIEYV